MKNLYRLAFNYHRTAVILYRYANSEKQAWLVACRYLANRDGVSPKSVMGLFDGSRDNYEITIEMEVKEGD